MFVFIPLGGTGERFKQFQYNKPKGLIQIFGKPMIFYLLDCLDYETIDFIYICYNQEYKKYRFEDLIRKNYPHLSFHFHSLDQNTRGSAETLSISLHNLNIDSDCPMLSLDADNFYTINIIKQWNGQNCVFTFIDDHTDGSLYSYIKLDENNVSSIVEKEKISKFACCGAYGFSSYRDAMYFSDKIINNNRTQKNEFYLSGIIQEMINKNKIFINQEISFKDWHCLGTPMQLIQFYNNYPSTNIHGNRIINKKRICFDLDNTLVTYPKTENDYTTVKPIEENIQFLRYLKTFGNTIIIYTARRMKTHQGNIGKTMTDIGKITFDTLEQFNIPFDEIYFGKPYADIYIDDLAINCFDELEKELGFYNNKIYPREFNSLEKMGINKFKKKGLDLSGEIYYYQHIPNKIKDMFPLFINFDINDKWYVMEKINGTTITSLYTSQTLTNEMLIHIMNSIKRIHECQIDLNDSNYHESLKYINENYSSKVKKRFSSFEYSIYNNYEKIFEKIINELEKYEKSNLSKLCVIHGDPVMTNILVNEYGKIKFIDMRGKLGNLVSIYGDWLYDWAKLYQSLFGYDCTLQQKFVDINYKNEKLEIFQNYFLKHYSEQSFRYLKIICASLFFSLIPIHNNDKCKDFYKLCAKILSEV